MRVIEVDTASATLEWAVSAEQLHWALDVVRAQPDEVTAAIA
jgi:hypothetical protein